MEWHGARTEGRLPRERYVWSKELREAYREVVKLPDTRTAKDRFGWGTVFVWRA